MSTSNLDSYDLSSGTAALNYNGGAVNEDLMQKIWDISRIPLPFTDAIGSGSTGNRVTGWIVDKLATPSTTNAQIDGADITGNQAVPPQARYGNHCQILTKVVRVSSRNQNNDSVDSIGRLATQVMKRQQELRRDIEATAISANPAVVGTESVAPQMCGLANWILGTGAARAAGGVDPTFTVATQLMGQYTGGTSARALTETLVRSTMQAVYQRGGDPTMMMMTPNMVAKWSAYCFTSSARIATLTSETTQSQTASVAKGAINVFVTDFGVLRIVANRVQSTYDPATPAGTRADEIVFLLDPEYMEMAYLSNVQTKELATNGLSDNQLMFADTTLRVMSPDAQGAIFDIDGSLAVTA